MNRQRLVLGLLATAGSACMAHAAGTAASYGPSLQASGPDTPPAAVRSPDSTATQANTRPSSSRPVPGSVALADALGQVYLTNPQLLEERAKLRATDENVPIALAGWRPQISYSAAPGFGFGTITNQGSVTTPVIDPVTNRVVTDPVTGAPVTTTTFPNSTSANSRAVFQQQVTATQPIYRGGRTTAQTAQAENEVRAERARLMAQEEQSFSDAVSAYVGVIEDQQLYDLQVSNAQVLSKQLEATNARFSVGEITRTDVAQAQAALAGAVAERETAYGTLQTARATYLRVIGSLPDKLVDPQPLALPVTSEAEADTLAAVNNASVVAAMYDDASSKDQVDAAYAVLMPQASLQVNTFYNGQTAFRHNISRGGLVGAQITVPLYQGGSEYAGIRQAKQSEQQSRRLADDTRRSAIQQATQFWEQYVASRATVASTRAQIRADEIALDGVEREALAGTQTTLDVLNAQQLLLGARVTLVQNLAALVNNSYALAGAIGRLTARDLGLDVPMYDEKAYYQAVRDLPFGDGDRAVNQPGR